MYFEYDSSLMVTVICSGIATWGCCWGGAGWFWGWGWVGTTAPDYTTSSEIIILEAKWIFFIIIHKSSSSGENRQIRKHFLILKLILIVTVVQGTNLYFKKTWEKLILLL